MWTVPYNGADIDIDPLTLDMSSWDDIEQRAGISGLPEMVQALFSFKPNAWRVLYWAGARRAGDQSTFGDFRGPNYGEILSNRGRLEEFANEVKALMSPDAAAPKDDAPASNG